MQVNNPREPESQSPLVPRARAIIEFIEGDLSKPPIIYPTAGSDEMDEALARKYSSGGPASNVDQGHEPGLGLINPHRNGVAHSSGARRL